MAVGVGPKAPGEGTRPWKQMRNSSSICVSRGQKVSEEVSAERSAHQVLQSEPSRKGGPCFGSEAGYGYSVKEVEETKRGEPRGMG